MKKNTLLILLIIGIMCSIGIGYAYLSAKLNIEAGVSIAKHGESMKVNFWTVLLSSAFTWFLLYKGGFFDVLIK